MTTVYDSRGLPTLQAPTESPNILREKLGSDVRRGALWTAASTVLLRLGNIGIMAVVARIVAPDELGVFALAMAVQLLVVSMAEAGMATVIVRKDIDAHQIAPTVVTIAVGTSITVAALLALCAGPIANAIGSPDATEPIRILAITVALTGPFAVPGAQLQRDFRQDVIFRANLISFVPTSVTLVVLAATGDGAIAFSWSRVVGQLVVGTIMIVAVKERYWPGFNTQFFRPLLRFGIPLAVANLLSQLIVNVDFVIVGRELSTSDVGIYMLAFNIAAWPISILGSVLNGVVIPAFSSMKREGGDPSTAVARAVQTVALIAFPLTALTFTFATSLIVTVYGNKWEAAAPVLAILAVYGLISSMSLLFANIIAATGRTWLLMTVQIVVLVALVPAMLLGVSTIGLTGVAYAHIGTATLIVLPIYMLSIRHVTGAQFTTMARAVARPALAATGASIAGFAVSNCFSASWAQLFSGGFVGVLLYIALAGPQLQRLIAPNLTSLRLVTILTRWPVKTAERIRR